MRGMLGAFTYLARRFFYRAWTFLEHWYVRSGRIYSNFVLGRLERLDRVLAWKITARHLLEPLYKDYSVIGYMLGFLFRFVRLIVASAVYAVVFIVAVGCYLLWLALPLYLIAKAVLG